jgi:hypothetical protein
MKKIVFPYEIHETRNDLQIKDSWIRDINGLLWDKKIREQDSRSWNGVTFRVSKSNTFLGFTQ